jgi:V/A-type H+-transporting ATPase subunit K
MKIASDYRPLIIDYDCDNDSDYDFEELQMDANLLVPIGAGLAIGLAAIGTGLAQARIGAASTGLIAEKPEMLGAAILLIAIPETMVILGFAVAAMILFL